MLFVGEAPGDSEDVIGNPFVGPAGLNFQAYVIDKAVPSSVRYALCNVLGCITTDEHRNKISMADVPVETLQRCSPRLRELVTLCKPKLIVCVGDVPSKWLDHGKKQNVWSEYRQEGRKKVLYYLSDGYKIPRVHILHPAFIVRQNVANQGIMWQRCELEVDTAIEEHITSIKDVQGKDPF